MGSFFKPLKRRLISACLLVMAFVACLFMLFVDLQPKVSSDFFFGSDDPELAQSARIHALFPSDEFLIISAASHESSAFQRARKVSPAQVRVLSGNHC